MTNSKLDKFLNLVDASFEGELESSPMEMANLQMKLQNLLKESKQLEQQSWKVSAKSERTKFAAELKSQIADLVAQFGDKKKLWDEIVSGGLGSDAKFKLQTQFRNAKPEDLSEKDIQAILGDQKVLELLKKSRKK